MTENSNNQKERHVQSDAFLVSKTDTKGIITYCNLPFANIVGVKNGSELIGKPHNVIRHPDMPRVIFKLLWEHIQDKREIFAYVKNKSFDGSFYWVFANVTASLDSRNNIIGYYSVRRKPNEKALQIIKPFYQNLLQAELQGGMETSLKMLDGFLKEKGVSYSEFVNNLQRL